MAQRKPAPSPFCATEIGLNASSNNSELIRSQFREESKVVCAHLSGIHHARKIGHMQVNYADTVTKLSQFQSQVPTALDSNGLPRTRGLQQLSRDSPFASTSSSSSSSSSSFTPTSNISHAASNQAPWNQGASYAEQQIAAKQMRMQEYEKKMSEVIQNEHHWNHSKRMYNREVGRKAAVHDIMAGKAPPPKYVLFPQKMNHSQMLAMTKSIAAPDARIPAPPVKTGKKWGGDGVGWLE